MYTICFFLPAIKILLLTAIWFTWWFNLLVLLMVVAGGFIWHNLKMNALLHQNANLERKLLERTELLSYAKTNAQKASDDAASANQNKSALIAKISHDIRTPMNTIMGMASLLTETTLNNEQQEYTSTILFSGENLLSAINEILMNDILEYSKFESGKELEYKEFDLRTNIEEVIEVFALKAGLADVELVYDLGLNVPSQIVGDALRLRQILMNLVEHALHYTSHGEIFLGVKLLEQREDNRIKLEFEIRDNGTGLSSEKLAILAKQLNTDLTDSSNPQIDIALTVCKKLIRLMGGTVTVESEEKKGTTFRFTIITTVGKQAFRSNIQSEITKLKGKKVLIADSHITVSHLLRDQLEIWNLAPTLANSANRALAILGQRNDFDLVMIDMNFLEMDGIELAERIKKINQDLPVVLMNKKGSETYKKQPELFTSIINKPLKQHVLSTQLLNLLAQKTKETLATDAKQKLSVDFAKQYPLNILIAEDDKMNQKLVTKVLNKLGYEPQIAENGKDVLEVVSHKNYDLILMDVQMPEMDGLEATRMIRVCLSEQPIIIAMTANTLQGDREECFKAGMDDYIGKPVRLDGLVNIIEKWALQGQQKL
jgi:CheY-like chemotaxis protein/signal transduction histidine kinase